MHNHELECDSHVRVSLFRHALAMLCLVAIVLVSHPSRAMDFDEFFQRSSGTAIDELDRLAPRIPILEIPLAARAFDRREEDAHTVVVNAYEAFARWHFWMGEHFDRGQPGLWGIDPVWIPRTTGHERLASAWMNSLQLVELEALANMAARRGLVYDALVWWTERRRLESALARELHDPSTGAYVDLDSTGAAVDLEPMESLLPLALGAPHIPTRSLRQLRELWSDPDSVAADLSGFGERVGGRARRLALALRTCQVLHDRRLERRIRSALALRGVEVEEPLLVAASLGGIELEEADLIPRERDAVRRARVAIAFLRQGGFVATEGHAQLDAQLDSLLAAQLPLDDELADQLTDALVEWRGASLAQQRSSWIARREQLDEVDPPGSQFHSSDDDAPHWIDRALDLLAEVVVGHALQSKPSSPARLRFVADLRGSGDTARLELRLPPDARREPPANSTLLWTDGISVLSSIALDWRAVEGGFEADVARVPDNPGLWRAIVTGIADGPRTAPSLAVVEALDAEVIALTPRRNGHPHRIRLRSRVDYPLRGAIEVDAPLSWRVTPSARITYALGPGETRYLDVGLSAGPQASPGVYPVHWHFYDGQRELRARNTEAVLPYRWVSIGPFDQADADFGLPAGLLPVDFSESLRGADGPLRWRRVPDGSLGAGGALNFEAGTEGWHYALTAFTTGSRQARITVQADHAWVLHVNGTRALRSETDGVQRSAVVDLRQGANQVLVGSWQGADESSPCSVRLESLEGTPLAGADDTLEMTLEGYAYVQGDGATLPQTTEHFERDTLRLIPLSYANPGAARVSVVGSFNGWSPERTPMTRDDSGKWIAGIRVPPGRFEYKFAVDGQLWIADPANPHRTPDGFGGENSLLIVE